MNLNVFDLELVLYYCLLLALLFGLCFVLKASPMICNFSPE